MSNQTSQKTTRGLKTQELHEKLFKNQSEKKSQKKKKSKLKKKQLLDN